MSAEKQESLAEAILGISPVSTSSEFDPDEAIMEALDTLGYDAEDPVHASMIGTDLTADENRHIREIMVDYSIVEQAVGGEIDQASTMADWPTYRLLMDSHGRELDGGRALLIGSYTALSSQSFLHFAKQQYGTDKNYIIDLFSTKPKSKHGIFTRASGLHLPFASESMDVVHTNRLLNELLDRSSPGASLDSMIPRLCAEIGRVLVPGGQVVMCEVTPGTDKPDITATEAFDRTEPFTQFLVEQFANSGCDTIRRVPGILPDNSNFLFETPTPPYPEGSEVSMVVFGLHATKNE